MEVTDNLINKDYSDILETVPLPEKYLLVSPRADHTRPEGQEDITDLTDIMPSSDGDNSPRWQSSSSDSNDGMSLDGDHGISFTVPSINRVRAGHYELTGHGRSRSLPRDGSRAKGRTPSPTVGYERKSEERDPSSGGVKTYGSWKRGTVPGEQYKLGTGSLPRPLSTDNIMCKVKDLLGEQAARNKLLDIVETQKAIRAKKKAMDSTNSSTKHGTKFQVQSNVDPEISVSLYNQESDQNSQVKSDVSLFQPTFGLAPNKMELDDQRQQGQQNIAEDHWNKGLNGLGFPISRTSDSVPTAHVSPSPLVQANSNISPQRRGLHKFPSSECLRDTRGPSTGNTMRRSMDFTEMERQLFPPNMGQRWNSHNNMVMDRGSDDFHALAHDPNTTQDPTVMYHEGDDADPYKRKPVNIGLATRQARYDLSNGSKHGDIVQNISRNTTSSANRTNTDNSGSFYAGYSRDFPPREPYRTSDAYRSGAPVITNPDRGYPYSHHGGVQSYNPQSYSSQDFTYPAYPTTHVNPPPAGDQFASDLTSWQQRHQEALRRQQMEASQPNMFSAGMPNYPSATQPSASNLLLGDPHKLDAVRRAADNIIKEKDMIIERQKVKIIDLENQSSGSELEHQKDLLRRAQEDNGSLGAKLQDVFDEEFVFPRQEMQYENSSMKAQMVDYLSSKASGRGELEKKLGASEYELEHLRRNMDKEITNYKEELSKLVDKITDKDTLILEWKDKFSSLKQQYDARQKKMDSMERYLEDLPTANEHSTKSMEIQNLKEEVSRNKQHMSDLEKKLSDSQKGVKSRDGLIESLEQKEKQLQDKIDKQAIENKKLRERLSQDGHSYEDIEEMQYENNKLKSDLDKARKLLDTKHKKQQQSETKYKSDITQLEERLSQEESTVIALREEVSSKEQHLRKLRQSFKELDSQNQDLMEQKMRLQDSLKEIEQKQTGEALKLETRLIKEINVCFTELQSLVQICLQRAEGQDPNISVLLGVKACSLGDADLSQESSDNLQSLKFKVTKIREMRNEIDKLREIVSNKYAEDMGDNLNCTTQ